jgi:hypothetical protein
MAPPASADPFASNHLGDTRQRSAGGFHEHPVFNQRHHRIHAFQLAVPAMPHAGVRCYPRQRVTARIMGRSSARTPEVQIAESGAAVNRSGGVRTRESRPPPIWSLIAAFGHAQVQDGTLARPKTESSTTVR